MRESIPNSIPNAASSMAVHSTGMSPRQGIVLLLLFAALLVLLPALMLLVTSPTLSLSSAMYRAGALVFGGGHVVLPLLEAEFVQPVGSMSADHFWLDMHWRRWFQGRCSPLPLIWA
ncbi:chromate transporter [Plesiomonas shigelloides]|nr:chromate transporter [Plesiomonas shigelloides]